MTQSIIIIGAGMGGLATGIYGQLNGFKTRIFEMFTVPGGAVRELEAGRVHVRRLHPSPFRLCPLLENL